MWSFENQVEYGISLLKKIRNIDVNNLKTIDLSSRGISGVYIYESIRGGLSILVDNKGEVLAGSSAKSLDQLIEDFKKGKRSMINKTETNQTNNVNILNYFKEKVFTIESKLDPSWESICQKWGLQVVENLLNKNMLPYQILVKFAEFTTNSQIQEFLIENKIDLPLNSPRTTESYVSIFAEKFKKAKALLENIVK